jgi:hypothetical protein
MNSDYIENNPIKYLKNNYKSEFIICHPEIHEILEDEFRLRFLIDMRDIIENLNQKYIDLYSYSGLFKKDLFNSDWERTYDIIYSNIIKSYDINVIYNNAEKVIDILEK